MREIPKFESPQIEKVEKKEKEKKEPTISELTTEALQEIKKAKEDPTILEKIRNSRFMKRIAFLTLFLSSMAAFDRVQAKEKSADEELANLHKEAVVQFQENKQEAIESAKEAVNRIDNAVKAKPDKTGTLLGLQGKKVEFQERKALTLGGERVYISTEDFLAIRTYGTNQDHTINKEVINYMIDLNKDGQVDKIIQFHHRADEDINDVSNLEGGAYGDYNYFLNEVYPHNVNIEDVQDGRLPSRVFLRVPRDRSPEPTFFLRMPPPNPPQEKWYDFDIFNSARILKPDFRDLDRTEKARINAIWEATIGLESAHTPPVESEQQK